MITDYDTFIFYFLFDTHNSFIPLQYSQPICT